MLVRWSRVQFRSRRPRSSPAFGRFIKLVGFTHKTHSQFPRNFFSFVLIEPMFRYETGEECGIRSARYIVPGWDREKCARIVVESDGVIEPGSFCGELTKSAHAFR